MAAVLPARPACDSSPATPGAQSIKVKHALKKTTRASNFFVHGCVHCKMLVSRLEANLALCSSMNDITQRR